MDVESNIKNWTIIRHGSPSETNESLSGSCESNLECFAKPNTVIKLECQSIETIDLDDDSTDSTLGDEDTDPVQSIKLTKPIEQSAPPLVPTSAPVISPAHTPYQIHYVQGGQLPMFLIGNTLQSADAHQVSSGQSNILIPISMQPNIGQVISKHPDEDSQTSGLKTEMFASNSGLTHSLSVDRNTICRLCAQKNKFMEPITDEIITMLRTCFPHMKVEKKDNLPNNVCQECDKLLISTHNFTVNVMNATASLNKMFGGLEKCKASEESRPTITKLFKSSTTAPGQETSKQTNQYLSQVQQKKHASENETNPIFTHVNENAPFKISHVRHIPKQTHSSKVNILRKESVIPVLDESILQCEDDMEDEAQQSDNEEMILPDKLPEPTKKSMIKNCTLKDQKQVDGPRKVNLLLRNKNIGKIKLQPLETNVGYIYILPNNGELAQKT